MEHPPTDPVTLVDVARPGLPGCLTVTAIDATGEDLAVVDEMVGQIVTMLVEHSGYLGTLFAATTGDRHFTVSAWTSVDDVEALRTTSHGAAVRAFFAGGVGTRVMTSVWVPHHLNDVWVRSEEGHRPRKADAARSVWL